MTKETGWPGQLISANLFSTTLVLGQKRTHNGRDGGYAQVQEHGLPLIKTETQYAKPKYFAVSYDPASCGIDLPHFHCMFKRYVFNSIVLYL